MSKEVIELQEKIRELKSRLPAHSIKPNMLQELEDLEDELRALLEREDSCNDDRQKNSLYTNGKM